MYDKIFSCKTKTYDYDIKEDQIHGGYETGN